MDKENIIDYKEWNCPRSWEELALKQYQDIERLYDDKDKQFDIRDVVCIMYGKTIDEVNALPSYYLDKILAELKWMDGSLPHYVPSSALTIDGVTYKVNVKEQLKCGEYVLAESVMQQDKHNYAALLGILLRKEGEEFNSKFENEILPSRVDMFEKIKAIDALKIVAFFLNLWLTSKRVSQLYMAMEEEFDRTQKHIETLKESGVLSGLSTILLKRKLKKLRKSMHRT